MKMLTSANSAASNQYLRPDYISPLPNALDAKNSPLALLAQTCSAIGSDVPNPKLIANMEKVGKKNSLERDKTSPSSHSSISSGSSGCDHIQISQPKSSFKPYEPTFREKTNLSPDDRSARIKTPKSSGSSGSSLSSYTNHNQSNVRCESNQSASSPVLRSSPLQLTNGNSNIQSQNGHRKTPSVPLSEKCSSPSQRASSKESSSQQPTSSTTTTPSINPSYYPSSYNSDNSVSTKDSLQYSKSSLNNPSNYFGAYGAAAAAAGLGYPMDLMTASALMSPHHAMLKAASMNPYLNFAASRMKGNGSATESMMAAAAAAAAAGMCRDPYCTGCTLSPHMITGTASNNNSTKSNSSTGTGTCPAGCTQCDHPQKSYASQLTAAAQGAAAAYAAHAQLAALAAASQMPYICNWIASDAAYCGKRFSTSDELLQHLRTHTNGAPSSMMTEQMMSSAAAAAAVAAGLPPNHPLFQRTYPTPPLSPMSATRYHPYGKPYGPPMTQLPHPSLAQYFSPYSLYGQRLPPGTPPGMHP